MKLLLNAVLMISLALMVTPQTIQELVRECKKTVPISAEQEKSFLELKFPPEEKTTHCLMRCIGSTLQVFNDETGIDLPVIKTMLKGVQESSDGEFTEDQVKCVEAAETKGEAKEEDECMMAFRAYQCFEQEFLALMKKDLEQGQ
ncbi:uncharacterized protein LOC135707586 [Ochlerotatus camptorhynchus]|uniref:uncharacterized protein LOC135707586 n=1 Tax=Ochlerotatus camptorhynchus TaxID=644619 RepID=UPI0031D39359